MERRNFLRGAALAGTGAALATPAVSGGHGTVLTMVQSWSRGFAVLDDAARYFADFVAKASDGTLTIDRKAPGELVGALEVFDAVTSGQADMYHSADYYFIGQHPALAFFTAVPFGGTAQEVTNWYYHGGGEQIHDEIGQIFNFKGLLAGNSGGQSGGWFRKEMKSPDDFNGLKYRMPGLGGKVLGKLGASVQNIPGGELYQALSSGALDGLEWVGPAADERAGFWEVAKVYYTAGFHEPGSALSANINLDKWNSLSEQHQHILRIAGMAATLYQLAETFSANGAALQRMQAQGVKALQFPDEIWDAYGEKSAEVMDENMDDELFRTTRASFEASLADSAAWISKSDGYYVQQRVRVLGGS